MFFSLWAFWIIITGSFHFQQLIVGAILSLFLSWFNNDLFFRKDERPELDFRALLLFVRYAFHLVVAILIANFQVVALVLHPKMPISPGMIRFSRPYKKNLSKVLLANSITLTPGTLTVLVDKDDFVIHALTKKNAEEVVKWQLNEELSQIEIKQEKRSKESA
ncbi:MAG: Na+/H+ antiporter subunit E [Bacillota bacterium]|nr:Na+/H+ antiporter subunit E [Bacillota bacterium]